MSRQNRFIRWLGLTGIFAALMFCAGQAFAATCTSKATGNWSSSSTWTCTGTPTATVPGSSDTVVLASPYTVTLDNNNNGNFFASTITINSGATLTDSNGNTLTVTGNITNNGIFTSSQSGYIYSTGNAAVISGSGSFQGSARLATSGTAPSIAAGSNLSFTGSAQFRIGRDANANAVAGSTLTINGTLTGTSQTGGTGSPFIRLYSSSTIVSSTGVINGGTSSAVVFYAGGGNNSNATATLTNNGSVTVGTISRSQGLGVWTNAASSSLTLNTAFSSGSMTLNASASNNTVVYNSPATPITPASNTYYNLSGTGVSCPVSYIILGTSPCAATTYVTGTPSTCTSTTGVGTVAWSNPGNAKVSDGSYATSTLGNATTSNYLNCSGFNLNVPTGAVISGITVSVTRKSDGGTIKDAYVYLIKSASISTAFNGATSTTYPTSNTVEAHGGQSSLWGTTWTSAILNASNFGVAFASQNTSSSWWCASGSYWASSSYCINTASVDLIQVRVDYKVSGLDHIRIEHDTTAAYCLSEPITLKACANAACTSYYTASDVTGVGLAASGTGNTWSPSSTATITAASGGINTGSITLAHSSAGTVTLGITGTASPAPTNAYECYNTGTGTSSYSTTGSCDVVFSNGAFSFHVPDHVSGTAQAVTMTSCASSMASGSRSVSFWTTYVDPASGTLKANVAAGSSNANCTSGSSIGTASGSATSIALTFGAGTTPQATFSVCYPDVGRVQLNTQYSSGGTTITGSSSFVARPHHFTVTGIKRTSDSLANPAAADATGGAFIAAGNSTLAATQFTAKVSAVNALNAVTPNYGVEGSPEGLLLTPVVVAPTGGDAGLLTCKGSTTGCAVTGGSSNFTGGATTLTDLAWNEVGVLSILPSLTDGSYMGTADVGTPTASGNIGRFYPHHFGVVAAPMETRADLCSGGFQMASPATACDAFNYMGELMLLNFQLLAQEAGGTTAKNYITSSTASQNFAKLSLSTSAALNLGAVNLGTSTSYLTSRLDTTTNNPSGSFLVGAADVVVPFTLTRLSTPDGNYTAVNYGIAPVDSDGVALASTALNLATVSAAAGNDHAVIDNNELRYGRLRMLNAYGSELLALPVPLEAQYWTGSYYATNTLDSSTLITPSSIVMGNYRNALVACKTLLAPSAAVTLVAGKMPSPGLMLSAPGTGNAGSVDLSLNLGATASGSNCFTATASTATAASLPWFGTNPTARATFGIYKSPLIYRRENY